MKFKNKNTGVILDVTSVFVLEQIKKSNDYIEVKAEKKATSKKKSN